ncbi:MAG: ATP-binding protein [Simkania negevensis]|nr:ATP-binding protein [Simkania negevensis]
MTFYIKRLLSERVKKLFSNFPCLVLTGARQVGKSTLLKHLFPEVPIVVFDPVHDIQNARKDPELFLSNHPPPLILDEVQYAPELVPVLKRWIDQSKEGGQYILTGSQQWGILKQVAESLAGRAILIQLENFSLGEMASKQPDITWLERWLTKPDVFFAKPVARLNLPHTLYEHLWRGFYPEAQFVKLEFIPDFHFSYQSTYIEKDIRILGDISDFQQFSRFVRLVTAHSAQEINYSHLGREIGLTPQTTKRWLNLLIHTFEWFEIPAYSNNSVKKMSLKTKGYFADTGQICFSQMISSKEAIGGHPLWGALFESAVVSEIRKQAFLLSTPPYIYHWRAHSGAECDLILERDGKFYPMEIKAAAHPTKEDARGIAAFRKQHPHLNIQRGLIIAPTPEAYAVTEKDWVIPWDLA